MEHIAQKQREFFQSGATKSYEFRKKMLLQLKDTIMKYKEEAIAALHRDLGKSETEAILTEFWLVLEEINYHLTHLKRHMKPKRVSTHLMLKPGKSYRRFVPLGVTLIISPWNYPFQLTLLPLAASIAAGNTTVIKPSMYSYHTTLTMQKIIEEAFDPTYIAFFLGGRKEANMLLDQNFDHIFFTGSPSVGQVVYEKAAKHLSKITLELGGKSPAIVDITADIKKAAKRVAFGKIINCGQTCVAPDYVLVHESVKNEFINELIASFQSMYPNGYLENNQYPKIITERHYERFCTILDSLPTEDIYYGGKRKDDIRQIEPTIVVGNLNSTLMKEEIFGPILPVLTYQTERDIETILHKNPYPLAFYVFAKNKQFIENRINQNLFGGSSINDTLSHLIGHHLPFGGVKTSGLGRYHGRASFETFSHEASLYYKHPSIELNTKYMPYSSFIKRLIRKWFLEKK